MHPRVELSNAEKTSRRSVRREFVREKPDFPEKLCPGLLDHPVVMLDNETGATARLCRTCHSGVISRCQPSSECHSDLSRNTFVFWQFHRSYFTFSRTKRANRAKAFQSDNSSVSGWQRARFLQFCQTHPQEAGVQTFSSSTVVDTFVRAEILCHLSDWFSVWAEWKNELLSLPLTAQRNRSH